MELLIRPCGSIMTNCYILKFTQGELIVDPGIEATDWVLANTAKPLAILNTHGHYDHVWSNAALKEALQVPLVCPAGDAFMLREDIFGLGLPESVPDVLVEGDETLEFGGIPVRYIHFPGHTPGCSVIVAGGVMLSGDFVFKGTIGRYDFPYSDAREMERSIAKFCTLMDEMVVYPGHGPETSIKAEQANMRRYGIRY